MKHLVIPTVAADPMAHGFDAGPWRAAPVLELSHHMGAAPEHKPRTRARVLYDADALYVQFVVDDRYVRAVATETHGPVWQDSCVEFFFTPGGGDPSRYFNVEVNCGGTILMHHGVADLAERLPLAVADVRAIDVRASLPARIDPERTVATTWWLRYRLPFAVLEQYAPVQRPSFGVVWRANFYKCADATSHPHWLTWAPVDLPEPQFHAPQFFGQLTFD